MARQNWQALQIEYIRAYAKTGISIQDWCKKKGLNLATAKRYIKKPEKLFERAGVKDKNCEINCETESEEKIENSISYNENCEINREVDCEIAKPLSTSQINSQNSRKHGGYARYFRDKSAFDVVVDFSLKDEIDLMRQRVISTIESIEKFNVLLEKAETSEDKELYAKLIKSADSALDRAVARIESLNGTDNQMVLVLETIALRKAQTKKTLIEADKLERELNNKAAANDKVKFTLEF